MSHRYREITRAIKIRGYSIFSPSPSFLSFLFFRFKLFIATIITNIEKTNLRNFVENYFFHWLDLEINRYP